MSISLRITTLRIHCLIPESSKSHVWSLGRVGYTQIAWISDEETTCTSVKLMPPVYWIKTRAINGFKTKTNEDIYGHSSTIFPFPNLTKKEGWNMMAPTKIAYRSSIPFLSLFYPNQTNDDPNHFLFFLSFPYYVCIPINRGREKAWSSKGRKRIDKGSIFKTPLIHHPGKALFFMPWHLIKKKKLAE